MSKVLPFKGACVAIVTPFDETGINFGELGRMIDHQIANQTDAICITGTTGEAATMNDAEHKIHRRTRQRARPGHRGHRLQRHRLRHRAQSLRAGSRSQCRPARHALLQQVHPTRSRRALHQDCRRNQCSRDSLQCPAAHRCRHQAGDLRQTQQAPEHRRGEGG